MASHWQPIATAPKDGTRVLLAEPGYLTGMPVHNLVTGWWCPSAHYFEGGSWCDDRHISENVLATHWMPLPEPPAGEGDDRG